MKLIQQKLQQQQSNDNESISDSNSEYYDNLENSCAGESLSDPFYDGDDDRDKSYSPGSDDESDGSDDSGVESVRIVTKNQIAENLSDEASNNARTQSDESNLIGVATTSTKNDEHLITEYLSDEASDNAQNHSDESNLIATTSDKKAQNQSDEANVIGVTSEKKRKTHEWNG